MRLSIFINQEEMRPSQGAVGRGQRFLDGYSWMPPIADLLLGFETAPNIGLYLMRLP